MSETKLRSLLSSSQINMGETIIADQCTGEGVPIYSADTGTKPWRYSTHCRTKHPRGTIVIGARGSIGHPRLPDHDWFSCTQTTIALKPDRSIWDPHFLYYALSGIVFERVTAQQAVPMLTVRDLARLALPCPAQSKQRRIAEILSTIDEAIEHTEALIAKTQQIKAGLMHDLFTRGVLPNGQLRPPRSEAPDLYKESPLGWIPKEWETQPLQDACHADITYGIVQAGPHIPGGVPYIRTGDMSGDALNREKMLCTSKHIASMYSRSEVRTGDIVCAIRATVGKVLLVPEELDGANLTQGTARISPCNEIGSDYLLWAMRSNRVQDYIQSQIKGTTFSEITLAGLRQVPVHIPSSFDERQLIGERLCSCQDAMHAERQHLNEQKAIRLGLMHDLLTGAKA